MREIDEKIYKRKIIDEILKCLHEKI